MSGLEQFDALIRKCKAVQLMVEQFDSIADVGWLRVDTSPAKQQISACAALWVDTVTSHMLSVPSVEISGPVFPSPLMANALWPTKLWMTTPTSFVSSTFRVEELKEELKALYTSTGAKGNRVVFLRTDSHIADEEFLVYIYAIATVSGWIADLFTKEEVDGLLGSIASVAKAEGIFNTPEARLSYLISRVRKNLRVVLAFSPVGDTFRIRARRFPGLVNCTVIDQFHPWPRDALISVAERFLQDVELNATEDDVNTGAGGEEGVCSHSHGTAAFVGGQNVRPLSQDAAAAQLRDTHVLLRAHLLLQVFVGRQEERALATNRPPRRGPVDVAEDVGGCDGTAEGPQDYAGTGRN